MKSIQPVSLAVLCLALSACGGSEGGGSVASAPAPIPTAAPAPTTAPLVTSVKTVRTPLTGYAGLTSGTYKPIAIAFDSIIATSTSSGGILQDGDMRLTIDGANRTYTVAFAKPGFPASQTFDFSRDDDGFSVQDSDFGRHVIQTTQYSDGTTKVTEYDGLEKKVGTPIHDTSASTAESYSFGLNLGSGLHYVSYGVWNTLYLNPNQQYTSTGSRELFFVTGRRTNAGEIPITGTADYIAKINGIGLTDMDGTLPGLPFLAMRLHADFANRLINGSIDVPFVAETASSGPLAGIAANGGAPIEQGGDYRIPLTGQFNTGPNGIIALTGTVLGAFFGPAAEETGGVIQLNAAGQPVFAGSFVAGKTTP